MGRLLFFLPNPSRERDLPFTDGDTVIIFCWLLLWWFMLLLLPCSTSEKLFLMLPPLSKRMVDWMYVFPRNHYYSELFDIFFKTLDQRFCTLAGILLCTWRVCIYQTMPASLGNWSLSQSTPGTFSTDSGIPTVYSCFLRCQRTWLGETSKGVWPSVSLVLNGHSPHKMINVRTICECWLSLVGHSTSMPLTHRHRHTHTHTHTYRTLIYISNTQATGHRTPDHRPTGRLLAGNFLCRCRVLLIYTQEQYSTIKIGLDINTCACRP